MSKKTNEFFSQSNVFEADQDDFNSAVKQHFGIDYDFWAETEAFRDTSLRFVVNGEVCESDEENFRKDNKNIPHPYFLLDLMAKEGVIEKGTYFVSVV